MRAEYVRSLINAEQVIVNRAFFRNTQSIFRDFVNVAGEDEATFAENRRAFLRILDSGAITPFLVRDRSSTGEVRFETDTRGQEGWLQVNREVSPRCLRLSWDHDASDALIRRLALSYHNFSATIKNSAESLLDWLWHNEGRAPGPDDYAPFVRVLQDVARYADNLQAEGGFTERGRPKEFITRQQIYKQFVLEADLPVVVGKYDRSKPFAKEPKLIFDLKYATNLSDFLGVHAPTSTDSPSRDLFAEFEVKQIRAQGASNLSSHDELKRQLIDWKKRLTNAIVQQALTFRNFADFDMTTVEAARSSPEWREYIASLRAVLADPNQAFAEGRGFDRVHHSYARVLTYASRFNAQRRANRLAEAWSSHVSLVITIGGTVVSFSFTGGTGPILYRVARVAAPTAIGEVSPFLCRVVIVGLIERQAEQNLESGLIFLRERIADASDRAEALLRAMNEDPTNFQALRPAAQTSVEPTPQRPSGDQLRALGSELINGIPVGIVL